MRVKTSEKDFLKYAAWLDTNPNEFEGIMLERILEDGKITDSERVQIQYMVNNQKKKLDNRFNELLVHYGQAKLNTSSLSLPRFQILPFIDPVTKKKIIFVIIMLPSIVACLLRLTGVI